MCAFFNHIFYSGHAILYETTKYVFNAVWGEICFGQIKIQIFIESNLARPVIIQIPEYISSLGARGCETATLQSGSSAPANPNRTIHTYLIILRPCIECSFGLFITVFFQLIQLRSYNVARALTVLKGKRFSKLSTEFI